MFRSCWSRWRWFYNRSPRDKRRSWVNYTRFFIIGGQWAKSLNFLFSYSDGDLIIHKDQVKVLNYQVHYKGLLQDKIVTYWLAEVKNPQQDPILSDEHTEFRWLPKTAAVKLSGYKDFEEMVEYFDQTIKTL